MKYHRYITTTTIILLFSVSVYAENLTYLCVSEESTGFYYENGLWDRADFKVSDDKYILRKIKKDEFGFKDKENPYGLFAFGVKSPALRCSISKYSNDFICRVGVGEFFFSPESGRFIKTYTAGYWDGVNNNDNTPNITRGTCSEI